MGKVYHKSRLPGGSPPPSVGAVRQRPQRGADNDDVSADGEADWPGAQRHLGGGGGGASSTLA